MHAVTEIERELEGRVGDLGYELVEIRWAGSERRPLLKLRIDRPDSGPGRGITVDECATVSRALEPWLDDLEDFARRYVLEISSPGVDRPLSRERDFDRFTGERVAVEGHGVLGGRSRRLEGDLLGLSDRGQASEAVLLRLGDGEEIRIPRSEIRRVHLIFTWQ